MKLAQGDINPPGWGKEDMQAHPRASGGKFGGQDRFVVTLDTETEQFPAGSVKGKDELSAVIRKIVPDIKASQPDVVSISIYKAMPDDPMKPDMSVGIIDQVKLCEWPTHIGLADSVGKSVGRGAIAGGIGGTLGWVGGNIAQSVRSMPPGLRMIPITSAFKNPGQLAAYGGAGTVIGAAVGGLGGLVRAAMNKMRGK